MDSWCDFGDRDCFSWVGGVGLDSSVGLEFRRPNRIWFSGIDVLASLRSMCCFGCHRKLLQIGSIFKMKPQKAWALVCKDTNKIDQYGYPCDRLSVFVSCGSARYMDNPCNQYIQKVRIIDEDTYQNVMTTLEEILQFEKLDTDARENVKESLNLLKGKKENAKTR